MKGTVHAQNAGHREREMNWIAIDIIGNVKGIYGSKKDADCRAYALMLITPDAEALALSIGNIRENDRFVMAQYENTEDCIIFLRDSGAPVAGKERGWVRLTFQDRLRNFQKYRSEVDPEKLADNGDIMVWKWMVSSEPVWRVHSFTPESAALITNARLETADCPERESLFFVSSDPVRPLFLNVMEFMFTPGNDGEPDTYAYSLMVTPSSTVRMILSFSVLDGQIYNGERYGLDESSPDYRLYIETERFMNNYAALKQCSNSPVTEKDADEAKKARLARKGIKVTGGITRYNVSLSGRYRSMNRNSDPVRDGREGKTLCMVSVSGYIRNQPYGPGRRERRLIWVDGFVRGQWVRSGVTYVTVSD